MCSHNHSHAHPTRRDVLVKGSIAALAVAAFPNGTVLAQNMVDDTPGLEVGPFWVDEGLNRVDVRSDPTTGIVQAGLPMILAINVSSLLADGSVIPLSGAQVDLWEANGLGLYSDEESEGTLGVKYLRGYQISNAHGNVKFLTIYPGWYSGRTPHIHLRIRTYDPTTLAVTYNYTTQLFMDDAVTNDVYTNVYPYNTRNNRDTNNTTDRVYNGASADGTPEAEAGEYTLLRLAEDRTRAVASFNVVLDLTDATNEDASLTGGGAGGGGGTPPTGGGGTPPGGGGGTPPTGGGGVPMAVSSATTTTSSAGSTKTTKKTTTGRVRASRAKRSG